MPALCSPRHAQPWAESLEHSYSMICCYSRNESANKCQFPARESAGAPMPNLGAFPFFHGALLSLRHHHPPRLLSVEPSVCLMEFPSLPLLPSNPLFQAWGLPPPGSFPGLPVQPFLELLSSIALFVLNHSWILLGPNLSSGEKAVALKASSALTSPFVPLPHPRPPSWALCLLLLPKSHSFW